MFRAEANPVPEPRADDVSPAGAGPGGPFIGWRRRQFVVDARYQMRAGVFVGAVALVLLVLLNASLILQERAEAATASFMSPPSLAVQDTTSWALLLVGSTVFLIGVILVGVLESHRTAGAAYAIRRAVDAIRDGRPDIRIRLRRGDHLQDLATSVNQLAETIDAERSPRD
jgi:hypothetical protein